MRHLVEGVAVLLCIAVQGCIPNADVRRGDAAVARGDWREAEASYRSATERDPGNVALAKKYADARTNAITTAIRTAEACQASNDVACVDRELGYALHLDPTNVQAAKLRTAARMQLATRALDEARMSLDSGNPLGAWHHLDEARSFGIPSGREEEMARIERESAATADELARQLLERAKMQEPLTAASTLGQAHELAAGAAARNSNFSSTLAAVDGEKHRVDDEVLKAQIKAGEDALTRQDYDAATRAFDDASRVSGDARLHQRAVFASSMSAARRAVVERAFDRAAAQLRAAIDTQEDRGAARTLLDAVEPRVYRIRLESIAITPTKPGTNQPWVGKPWWRDVVPVAAAAAATWYSGGNAAAGKVAHDLTAAVTDIPPENRPALIAFLGLPDGRQLKSQKVKGIYVIYGAEFYLYTNQFDTRTVRLAVFHERSGGNESVAVANIPLGQIVSGKLDPSAITGDATALQQVVFAVEPADAWKDGGYTGFELQDHAENRGQARSQPLPSTTRVQLVSARLSLPTEGSDGDGSNPDPYFEVYQGKRAVLKSTVAQDTRSAEWTFAVSDLYLDPAEELMVKLTDADLMSDDHIATWLVPARDFLSGHVTLTTERGTTLSFGTAPRMDRPR